MILRYLIIEVKMKDFDVRVLELLANKRYLSMCSQSLLFLDSIILQGIQVRFVVLQLSRYPLEHFFVDLSCTDTVSPGTVNGSDVYHL